MELTPGWDSAITAILDAPGVTVVIGDVDTGKTTFTLQLANRGVAAATPTAVVDGDTGQAEIGPPAAISMATLEAEIQSLRELRPRRMYFVGLTTPVGNLLPTVVGARKMTDDALSRGGKLVIVDTSGLVKGLIGRRLKLHKVELLAPRHVVCIRKEREIDHIIAGLSKVDRIHLHVVQASSEARTKPRDFRIARRRAQFYEYFLNSERHIIRLDDIVCWGTYFTCGRPVKWQHYRTLERALKAKVLHAEVVGNGMYVVAECRPNMAGVAGLMEKYKTRDFTVVCGTDFSNVLVGLADSGANAMGLGIIEAVDFKQRHMVVTTPVKTITPVRVVQFGSMRVKPDGTEIGRIKPGEI